MKELIEKLENARDYIKGRTQSINVALKFEELELLLQALTSVKSEQMSYENQKEIQDNLVKKYPFVKSESAEDKANELYPTEDGGLMFMGTRDNFNNSLRQEVFIAGAKWMHDFANAEKKQHDLEPKFNKLISENFDDLI